MGITEPLKTEKMNKLKECIISKVEKKLPYKLLKSEKNLFRVLLGHQDKEKSTSRIEIIFWRPRFYTLTAYRYIFGNLSGVKDDFDIPFTISENHKTEWKNLDFLCRDYNNCEILESELMEVKRIGADEKGFYYSRHA